jgi:HK97 family phage prohead protease
MAAQEQRKHIFLEAKMVDGTDGSGELEGYGNIVGNIDRASEIVEPGAYKGLESLVKNGAGLIGHEWDDLPIATLEECREDAKGLYFRWAFHSTSKAQEARTIISERMARKKSVALSIGYRVLEDEYKTVDGQLVRVLKSIEVYEISYVNVPANAEALATGVKGIGIPLDDQVKAVLESFGDLTRRLAGLKELREKLSATRQAELATIIEQAKSLLDPEPEPEPVDDAVLAEFAKFEASL